MEGLLGIPLELVQVTRASCRDEAGNSGFLSSSDRDLGVPMEIPLGSQTSSYIGAWNSTSLSRWKRGVRPPVELRYVSGPISRGATELSVLHSCHELIPGVTFQSWQVMRHYLEWTGTLESFQTVARPLEFLLSFKVRPAST